jgi:phosphoenolpyruvate-protein phosphotransferase
MDCHAAAVSPDVVGDDVTYPESVESIVIGAPLDGWVVALADVPDAAFAAGLIGAGLAIDPISETVVAPCDGIVRMGSHRHAVTIETSVGEILIHVGIDTVALRGQGMRRLVEDGAVVRAGDLLLELDLDAIAPQVSSLITPVLAVGRPVAALSMLHAGGRIRRGEPLYRLTAAAVASTAPTHRVAIRRRVRIRGEHGLHARPAAILVAALQTTQAEVILESRGRRANARSVTALMALATERGEAVTLLASGDDANDAIAAIEHLFDADVPKSNETSAVTVDRAVPTRLQGLTAVAGAVMGPAYLLAIHELSIPETCGTPQDESEQLLRAVQTVMHATQASVETATGARRDVLHAHAGLLADPQLRESALANIRAGHNAAAAWRAVCRDAAAALRLSGDKRMAERAADLADIEQRVLASLLGVTVQATDMPDGAVVLAADLLPSQLLGLDRQRVGAIVTARGGVTAHVSILAAGMNLPMLVGVGPAALQIAAGTHLIVDADGGIVEVAPDESRQAAFVLQLQGRSRQAADAERVATEPARMRNGETVLVECNLGAATEAVPADRRGADGVGLLRTEFLFLDRAQAPTQDEQFAEYAAVTQAFGDRPVTIRTLDVGGDKPLPFIDLPPEENPALGLRGVRSGLAHLPLLQTQLDALAATPGNLRVLLPMVNDVSELRAIRALLAGKGRHVSLGVMIETPASALLASSLAAEADFFSIGSNDLAQYVLAIDRLHPTLGRSLDGLHPAVVRAMRLAVDAAQAAQRPVAVCGGLAADADAVAVLVGLGIRELSVAPGAVPGVKQWIRTLDPAECRQLAEQVMNASEAESARHLARQFRETNRGEST